MVLPQNSRAVAVKANTTLLALPLTVATVLSQSSFRYVHRYPPMIYPFSAFPRNIKSKSSVGSRFNLGKVGGLLARYF